jgi:hypothetical protein
MKLQCNFCRYARKTDSLWLVTVRNRDYLLCSYHTNRQELKRRYKDEKEKERVNTEGTHQVSKQS